MAEARTPDGVRYTWEPRPRGGFGQTIATPTDLHRLGKAMARLEEQTERAEGEAAQWRSHYEQASDQASALRQQLDGAEAKIDRLSDDLERCREDRK